jgi:hypothetical protein
MGLRAVRPVARPPTSVTCLAIGDDLRELFSFSRRLVAAGQRPILADKLDIGAHLVEHLGLGLVVVNTPANDCLACVKCSCGALLSSYPHVKLVFDCLAESQSWNDIGPAQNVYFFERGASPARIRSLLDMATFSEGVVGSVFKIDLIDFLQLVIMKRETRAMYVRGAEGSGRIIVKEGAIIDATCGSLRGKEALFRVLGQEHGQFSEVELPSNLERTIVDKSQGLLLEAMQLRDECMRGGSAGSEAEGNPPHSGVPTNDIDAACAGICEEGKSKQ